MTKKLFFEAIAKFILGFVLVSTLIFLPAGTIYYWNAWLFISILFIPMFFAGIVMMIKNPKLLESRLESDEKEPQQKLVIKLSGLMFILGFISAGLDFRYRFSLLPRYISILSAILFLTSYLLYAEVLRENKYLSRTIKTKSDQKVIDTGLYGVIRHPMYFSTVIMFLSIPIILGSAVSLFFFLFYPFIISARIKNEEEILEKELPGYTEYKNKVKYKLIPFLW